jgi:hypothetical protein
MQGKLLQGRFALALVLVASFCGCMQHRETGLFTGEREHIARMDDFEMLMMKAGIDEEDIPSGDRLSVEQANDLLMLLRFKIADGNHSAYGPRVLVSYLLEEALRTGQPVSRHSLTEGLRLHTHLVVLSPEGHLVRAYSGTALRCVGPLHIEDGVPGAGGYKVNTFYVQDGSSFREDPHYVAPAIFVLPSSRQPLERVADGIPR